MCSASALNGPWSKASWARVIEAIRSGKIDDYRNPLYSNVKFLTQEGLSRLLHSESEEENYWLSDVLQQETIEAPLK